MVLKMFSREFAVFIVLVAAALSSDLSFIRVSGDLKTDNLFIWEEADPVEVSCQDFLDATESPDKMRLWWELNDEKTEDEFVYSDTSKKISVKTAISHAMAKDGDKLFCVMAVADSDESTFVITHKKELPLKPIGLTLAAQPNMIAGVGQSLTLSCELSGENFESLTNVNLDLRVHDTVTDSSVVLEGDGTSLDPDNGHILAKFVVPTDTISTKGYRCDVTHYTMSSEVAVSVEIIGLIKDLQPFYVVPEGGTVDKLEAQVENYGWRESGYPKITFTLSGSEQASTSGATASEVNLGKDKFPASFKVEYKGEDTDNGVMFAPGFQLVSTRAELRELKIEGKTNVIETNSLEITCKIRVESGSDYEIQLKRDNRLIDSSTEPRLSSLDSFASDELKFTFTITDAKESDEVSYICVFDDVAESNAYEPKIHKLERAPYGPWLLNAQESPKLECYVAGVQLSETMKWRDEDNSKDLTHDEGGFKIENKPTPTLTSSTLMRNNVDTAGTKSFSCSLGDNAKQTFEVEVIAPTVTADIVLVTDDLEFDELTCTVPSQADKFSTQWEDPDGGTSKSITGMTGKFTCSVFFSTSFAGSPTGIQLSVDVYALTADTTKTIYYKPNEAKTLTCEYAVAPDLAANVDEVSFNYLFSKSDDTELQNSATNTYSWSENADMDIKCVISVTATGDKTVEAGTVTTTFSLREREVYVTEDGTRYVYETPDSVTLTCRMSASPGEEFDSGPTWYKGSDIYPSTGNFKVVDGEDYVEHVLTFDGVTKETAGEYMCTFADLGSEKKVELVVKAVSVSPSPLDKVFWMGLDSVTFSFEVGRVGNVIEYKVDADDGKSVDMTCETAESCTASLTYTRSMAAEEDKTVTFTISAKNDVSDNFLLGDVLNIPPIELTLHERTLTTSVPQDFSTRGYSTSMRCTARAEDNVEIKFVRRVDNEDIDDINEDAEQADYITALLTRKSLLNAAMTRERTAEEITTYHCVATYEGVDGTPGTMSTNLVTSAFIILDKPFIEVVGDSVTKTEDGRFIVPEDSPYTLKITYDSRALLNCNIEYQPGPIPVETKDGTGEVSVNAAVLSHSDKYYISGHYMYNDVKFELGRIYEFAELEVTEIDNSNDYMESDEGITITVRFSGTLKDKTVQWRNELTDQVYSTSTETKREATISVTQEEDYSVMVIPPGGLTENTSFKVTALLEDDTEVKHRQYVQVIDKVRVTKHVGKYSDEDVEVVFFIALNNYNTIPDVTTTPTAKHVHKHLLLGMIRYGVEFTVTVTADMAKTTASMTMNIEFNDDSSTEAEITFVNLDKPLLTIAETLPVTEGSQISINCKDSNMMDESDVTVEILVNGQPARGVVNEGAVGDTYSLLIRDSSYVHHSGVLTCQITDKFSDVDTVVSVSDGVEVSITEYESTTDYVISGGAIRLEVEFPTVVDTSTIEWEDEKTGKKYNLDSNPQKKRNAEKYVVEEGEKHIASIEIPAGTITESTSFKVSAKISGQSKTLFVRKYLQVIEPVHTVVLYDVGNAHSVGGTIDIAIDEYEGEPEISEISTTVNSYKFTTADDKLTLDIVLLDSTWKNGGTFEISGTIKLNDASSVQFSFRFYGIDIRVKRADGQKTGRAIVYDEDMSTEDREGTAFSCTFEEPAGHSSEVEATITHGVDNTKLESIKMTDNAVSVTYEDLSEEMEKEAEEGEEEEKEVVYKCNFAVVIAYEGTRGNIHREFIVKFNPADERDWGGVIAACVLAGIILLLLILFIVYRCCIVKKRKKEKSVPPDMKLSGGPIQETNIASPETHPKFNDAVNFLDKVEGRFKKEPDIYRTFLNTLTEYRAKRINKPDLARKVAILFEGHPDLVTEFNEFIKSKKKTDQEAAENQYTVIDTEVKTNPVATNDYIVATKTPSAVSPPPHPKFTAATAFVDQVQGRFANQPEVYKTFIKLLNDFKPKKMKKSELRTEVVILFNGHPDLIEGFNDFISSKKKKAELDNENVVVDIEGNKNGEVHVNKQVTEGTV